MRQPQFPPGPIDIRSFSRGMTSPGGSYAGGASGTRAVDVQDLAVVKYVDASTPKLMEAVCRGTCYRSAILKLRTATATTPYTYLRITMWDVHVTSVNTRSHVYQQRAVDTVSLYFESAKVEYVPIDPRPAQRAARTAPARRVPPRCSGRPFNLPVGKEIGEFRHLAKGYAAGRLELGNQPLPTPALEAGATGKSSQLMA
ncbi:MAG: type VI secretion system tube protein Hcp [Bacillota bacterium]|nr:MAG: type VI secretion system tube protein Hcp [Bacillota bacterium]